jgi:drug/metabolite transporter (DMT)-like permease
LAALRFGIGVMCLLPLALILGVRFPPRQDWPKVAGLGFMFFAVFFVFYNVASPIRRWRAARWRSRPCR